MGLGVGVASNRRLSGVPLADSLQAFARWMIWAAVLLTMTTPRVAVGTVHVNAGDLLGVAAGICWLVSWVVSPSKPMDLRAAIWPSLIFAVGALSAASSQDLRAAIVGLAELAILWVLPAMAVPNLLSTQVRVTRFLICVSVGSLVAGSANIIQALGTGTLNGGLPQVWGPVQYFQGYFQAVGLVIAASHFLGAITARRAAASLMWCLACLVNAGALLLTQTRGAWLAAIAAVIVLGILWRPGVLVGAIGVVSAAALAFWSADWASIVRERVQSIFSLEAGLSGFESSLGRLGLIVTAWRMFIAHPLLGIGLKNFPIAMPEYAPPEMPLAYEMGPDRILTAVEGPHSTYLALLSEVGVFGLLGLVCWEAGAMWRLFREGRGDASLEGGSRRNAAVLLAAATVVVVYNFFFEMTQTGMLVFVSVLALGYRARQQQHPT